MKSVINYHSFHHGNTEKVASVMAEALGTSLLKTNAIKDISFEEYDLYL